MIIYHTYYSSFKKPERERRSDYTILSYCTYEIQENREIVQENRERVSKAFIIYYSKKKTKRNDTIRYDTICNQIINTFPTACFFFFFFFRNLELLSETQYSYRNYKYKIQNYLVLALVLFLFLDQGSRIELCTASRLG